ncbi:MAG: threonine/serine dehydratase [Pseudomonadota bacterium]
MTAAPTVAQVEAARAQLGSRIVVTPTLELNSSRFDGWLPEGATVFMKMELFQQTGSFKARGATLAVDVLTDEERTRGVTAVSAGNHALAVSWAAQQAGISAKVVMPDTADAIRVDGCKALGAEVVLVANVEEAFKEVARLRDEEGRAYLHPFESPFMTLGAATVGHELALAAGNLDAAVVPIGGGGLISGMAPAIKALNPDCVIYGVEPEGADSMARSFTSGEPVTLEKVTTIADSLGAPMAMPDSYALTRDHVAEIIRLPDSAFPPAMEALYHALKIIAEPACAATLAAVAGPLKERLAGKRVGIIACGSNISRAKFDRLVSSRTDE